jgi:hypothetical protein
MAVYNANKMAAGTQPKFLPDASGVNVLSIFAATVAFLLNDTINFMVIPVAASDPGGPAILEVILDSDQIDSNVAPLMTLDVGDTNSGGGNVAQRFFAASNIAQAGGYAIPTKPAILGLQYTANTTIFATVHAAPATFKAGSIRLFVSYTFDV